MAIERAGLTAYKFTSRAAAQVGAGLVPRPGATRTEILASAVEDTQHKHRTISPC